MPLTNTQYASIMRLYDDIKTYAAFTVDITGILAVRTCKYIIKIISGLAY